MTDFHIPLKHEDIRHLEALRSKPETAVRNIFGEGMSEVLAEKHLQHTIDHTVTDADEADAPFHLDTPVTTDEGTTISGDALWDLIQEARAKKVTVASLSRKLPNVQTQVIVSPRAGVVEQAPRTGGRAGSKREEVPPESSVD
ncbi:MAG: hypothetical protein JWM91_4159 [Rhodospirillales bacterium]|nr:hypothetical protein [Rhodospirillales bacterium]